MDISKRKQQLKHWKIICSELIASNKNGKLVTPIAEQKPTLTELCGI